jgi:hypothetical protein
MYFDLKNAVILPACPKSGFNFEGALVQGLDIADDETKADCGYFLVRTDEPPQPENTIEAPDQRQATIDGTVVDIVRTWLPVPPVVPNNVSARQIRLWLLSNNISLAAVQTAIDAIPDPALRDKTKVEWEFAPYIERYHPLISTIGLQLGLTDADIDAGFIAAEQL